MPFTYKVTNKDTGGLNEIVKRYGFANYKQAGVSSVPSGNFDMIKEGDEITLNNYDPNKINTIQNTPAIISSKDQASTYNQNSSKVDTLTTPKETTTNNNNNVVDTTKTNNVNNTVIDPIKKEDTMQGIDDDPVYKKFFGDLESEKAKLDTEAENKKAEYNTLYSTSLADLDNTLASTLEKINTTFAKRIEVQKRTNTLNVDRRKAYGLSEGGQYTPIDFRDAISSEEREGADEISRLENERNALISEAKSARDTGKSKLLAEKLANLEQVDTNIRNKFTDILNKSEKKYELARKIQEQKEKDHQELVKKQLSYIEAYGTQNIDELGNKDPKALDTVIKELQLMTGGVVSYSEVFSTLNKSIVEAKKNALDIRKKEADIKSEEALANQRNKAKTTTTTQSTTGVKFTSSELKKLAQAGLSGADEQSKLDYLYGSDEEKEKAKQGITKSQTPAKLDRTKITYFNPNTPYIKNTLDKIDIALQEGYNIDEIAQHLNLDDNMIKELKKGLSNTNINSQFK